MVSSPKKIDSLLGSTRTFINRHMQNLKDEGLVCIHRNHTDVQKLLDHLQIKH